METERQRIERELRRQRSMAIGGRSPKTAPPAGTSTEKAPEKQVIRRSIPHLRPALDDEVPVHGEVPAVPPEVRKTIVIGKRRIAPVHEEEEPGTPAVGEPTGTGHADAETESPDRNVEIKDTLFRARDGIFEGKGVRKSSLPPVRDSTLLHTELKSKKKSSPTDTQTSADVGTDTQSTESPPAKKRTLAEKP
jgi:hypothetical protein